MALRLITAPTAEPVTLDEAKAHLRVDHEYEDTLIEVLVSAARENVEAFTGRSIATQTWELALDEFPDSGIRIPLPPLQGIVSIKYDDASGTEHTIATDQYYIDTSSEPGWVVPVTSWPTPIDAINSVRIRFIAGYSSAGDSPTDLTTMCPASIKAAILLHVGSMYENRQMIVAGTIVSQLPWGVENLLRPYRVLLGMA